MKASGMIRKVDELGRIVLPVELRRGLGIEDKDALEIFVDEDRIILKKYESTCIFCGNPQPAGEFKGKRICEACMKALKKI